MQGRWRGCQCTRLGPTHGCLLWLQTIIIFFFFQSVIPRTIIEWVRIFERRSIHFGVSLALEAKQKASFTSSLATLHLSAACSPESVLQLLSWVRLTIISSSLISSWNRTYEWEWLTALKTLQPILESFLRIQLFTKSPGVIWAGDVLVPFMSFTIS